jgi:signal transduction histidine kinase
MDSISTLDEQLLQVSKSAAIDSGDLDAAGRLLLSTVAEALAIKRVSIWFLNTHSTAMTTKLTLQNGEFGHNSELQLTRADYPEYFTALDTERAIVASDAHHDPATREFTQAYLQPLGIGAMLDAPIRHRGEMVGIVCAEHTGAARVWTAPEVAFVAAIADLYGRALSAAERNLYEQQLKRQNEALETQIQERTSRLEHALADMQLAQEQLLEKEKMAALGKMVAGVAHDVNTPLGVAVTAVSHCQALRDTTLEAYQNGSLTQTQLRQYLADSEEALTLIASNLARASRLIQNFKKTAVDQSHFELSTFNLHEYLADVLSSLRPMLQKKAITTRLTCPPDLRLHSYRGAFSQILSYLISNSCDHAFTDVAEPIIYIECAVEGQDLKWTYRDNGRGMNASTLEQACEPFFTTQRSQGASGLGLSIVYNLVVQQLGGRLVLASDPGSGLRVEMLLPNTLSDLDPSLPPQQSAG